MQLQGLHGIAKCFAMVAIAVVVLPAAAQSQTACSTVSCNTSRLTPEILKAIATTETSRAEVLMSSAPEDRPLRPSPREQWDQHIPARAEQEDYACLLSFGVGGQLGKQGFLGTRVLGKTQVWRKSGE